MPTTSRRCGRGIISTLILPGPWSGAVLTSRRAGGRLAVSQVRLGHCACSAARELGDRLREEAQRAQSNEDLVRRFVEACRRTRTILPATTPIERLCAGSGSSSRAAIRRRQLAAGPPRAPPAPRFSGGPLPRCRRASDHAAAPAGGTLLRRRAPRVPGQPSPRDSRGLRHWMAERSPT